MFSIRVLPPEESDDDGVRLGEITVGNFTEKFACYPVLGPVDQLDNLWRVELRKLIGGAPSVALINDPRFAWIIYREGQCCFVQEVLALQGDFSKHLATRTTTTEDGQAISEWATNITEIERFLGNSSAITA